MTTQIIFISQNDKINDGEAWAEETLFVSISHASHSANDDSDYAKAIDISCGEDVSQNVADACIEHLINEGAASEDLPTELFGCDMTEAITDQLAKELDYVAITNTHNPYNHAGML